VFKRLPSINQLRRKQMNEEKREGIRIGIKNRELNLTKSYAYCMFQNTQPMLEDCFTILDECGDEDTCKEYQGKEEERAVKRVIETACNIAEQFGGMVYAD
tara:strand:- start:324 stop:626 length:303 start_codon:yes stop_codon:yes gene_type:complete